MNALTTQEKLDLLNSLNVVDWDTGSGEVLCILIDDTPENRATLAQIVDGDPEEKLNSVAALETPEQIDISMIGFELAEYWSAVENKFHNGPPEEEKPRLRAMYEYEDHRFGQLMTKQLNANIHKGSWISLNSGYLLGRLKNAEAKLTDALRGGADAKQIQELAADVANFAMMIADVSDTTKKRFKKPALVPSW